MNPLFFFTLSSHPSSLLIILIVTIIITVNTLPIDEGENRASRIAAIHSHLPAELNATLGNLLNFVDDLTEDHPATQHHLCYKSQSELNIFNRSLPFTAVVQWYYLYRFSSKPITSASISRLLDSTQNIINQCSSKKGNGLKYDFTVLSDQAFPYREALLMESKRAHRSKSPKSLGRRSSNGAEGETSSQCKLLPMDTSSPLPLTFDWRDHQAVTPVRSQRLCGSCWLFASMAALESALLLHESFSGLDPSSLDLAEQQLIVCANGCKGAEVADAYEYILQHGITFERHLRYNPHPYSGYFDDEEDSFASQSSSSFSTSTCTEELHRLLQEEKDEDYFEESSSFPKIIYPLEGYCWLKNNTDMEMKRALLKFGPLYVSLNAADSGIASGEFEGGVVNSTDCTPDPLNHSVLLVGYTEDTWILKNSWGRLWNGDGYFEVVQGREMCGINREMAWPLLKKKVF